jgi:HEPN domain-containing protein
MNRGDLQRLSNARIREAKILLNAGEYSGAYYLSGYAVECALKACFAKNVDRYDFPERNVKDIFTHSLVKLVDLTDLEDELAEAKRASGRFAASWNEVCKWTEHSRYSSAITSGDAEQMLDALMRRKDGVLTWIKRHW